MEFRVPSDIPFLQDTLLDIETTLQNYVANAQAAGVTASATKSVQQSHIEYVVLLEGMGLDTLAQIVFQGNAMISISENSGSPNIYFQYDLSSNPNISAITLTLRGKRIIAGNGRQIDSETMIWEDHYGLAEAVLEAPSILSYASGDLTLGFYRGGLWQATLDVILNDPGSLPANGLAEIETYLEQTVTGAEILGIQASWHRTFLDGAAYQLQMQGSGVDGLNNSLLRDWATVEVNSSEQGFPLRRTLSFYETNIGELDFQPFSVTIRGGEIVFGNGTSPDGKTMTWTDHFDPIDVTFTEQPRTTTDHILIRVEEAIMAIMPWLPIFIVLATTILLSAIIMVLIRRSRRLAVAQRCPNCGFRCPKSADFCPGCGSARSKTVVATSDTPPASHDGGAR